MDLLSLALTALVVGAVFVYVKPYLDSALSSVLPASVTQYKVVSILLAGVLVLATFWVARIALRTGGMRGGA